MLQKPITKRLSRFMQLDNICQMMCGHVYAVRSLVPSATIRGSINHFFDTWGINECDYPLDAASILLKRSNEYSSYEMEIRSIVRDMIEDREKGFFIFTYYEFLRRTLYVHYYAIRHTIPGTNTIECARHYLNHWKIPESVLSVDDAVSIINEINSNVGNKLNNLIFVKENGKGMYRLQEKPTTK